MKAILILSDERLGVRPGGASQGIPARNGIAALTWPSPPSRRPDTRSDIFCDYFIFNINRLLKSQGVVIGPKNCTILVPWINRTPRSDRSFRPFVALCCRGRLARDSAMTQRGVQASKDGRDGAIRRGRLRTRTNAQRLSADMTTEWHQNCVLAIDHAGPAAFARWFHGLIACLLFAMSLPVFADCARVSRTCERDMLRREEKYNYQLAVCQKNGWHICEHSLTSTPYHLAAPSDNVEFFWAVPDSEQHEFIYVSTSYIDGQILSISRNSIYKTPRLFRVLTPFKEIDEDLGKHESIRQRFRDFHSNGVDRENDPVFNSLAKWHDTQIWGRLKSYDLVSASLVRREDPPRVAAERLIGLAKDRPKTSWARFTSRVQDGQELRIVLAYSGHKERRTWPFNFKVSWNVQVAEENEQ